MSSSRYDADNGNGSSERDTADAPLPTYEEVIGSENLNHVHVGFKTDVLLPPPACSLADQGQSSSTAAADAPNRQHEGLRARLSRCKPKRTGTILILLGMILIPMCAMIIILQIKVCATEQSQLQQSVDKINASYSECTAELSALQDSMYSQENRMRDLNYQVQKLNDRNKELQRLLFKKDPNGVEQ